MIRGSTAAETVDGVECDSVLSHLNYDVLMRRHHHSSRSRPWTVARVGTGTDDMAMASDVEQTTCYLTQTKRETAFPLETVYFNYYFNCCGCNM